MAKTKLTLSIDKAVIKEAKVQALGRDTNVSAMVEDFLKSMAGSWIRGLARKLKIKERYIGYDEVIRSRAAGPDSGKLIRAMRDERQNSVSR